MATVDYSEKITDERLIDPWITSDCYTVDHCRHPDRAVTYSGLVYDDDMESLPLVTSCLDEKKELYCSETSVEVTPDPGWHSSTLLLRLYI